MAASFPRNAYVASVLARARATRDRVVDDFGGLDERALNWKPGPDRWSVAQCLQHLIASNQEYGVTFEAIADGSHRSTLFERIPLLPRVWGPLIAWSMTPGNRVKVPTTETLQPAASDISGTIVEDFRASVDAHLERIAMLDHVDHGQTIVTSPFAGFVCYSLKDAVTISVVHLERHRVQAVRVTQRPGFPATA